MPTITFFALFIVVASGAASLYRQLQILQQNSYSLSQYLKWVTHSYVLEMSISTLGYCLLTVNMLNGKHEIVSLAVSLMFLAARVYTMVNTCKHSNKKLAFTARVKRLYVTAIILLGVLLLLWVLFDGKFITIKQIGDSDRFVVVGELISEIARTLCGVLGAVLPLLVVVIWAITYPVEKIIARCINNSKRISKDNEGVKR